MTGYFFALRVNYVNEKRLCLVLALASLFCILALFPVFRSTARADPATIFSDGFESGDFSTWTAAFGVTVQTSPVHSGTYSAYFASATICYEDFGSVSTCDGRAYIYISSLPVSGTTGYVSWLTNYFDGYEDAKLAIYNNAGSYQWQLFYRDGGTLKNATVDATIDTDTWYCVEIRVVKGTGTGEARLYVDGLEIVTETGLSNQDGYSGITRFALYNSFVEGGNGFVMSADDVVVDSSYIGPVRGRIPVGGEIINTPTLFNYLIMIVVATATLASMILLSKKLRTRFPKLGT